MVLFILLLLWMFDVIDFKRLVFIWLAWAALNIVCYLLAGVIYYNVLIAPILEMF